MRLHQLPLLLLPFLAMAPAADAAPELFIVEVFVMQDATPPQVQILGQGFTSGKGPLVVRLGDMPDLPVLWVTPDAIVAELPADLLPGDYFLFVRNGKHRRERDTYDLTVGGGGQGEPGPPGPQGPPGPPGSTAVGTFCGRTGSTTGAILFGWTGVKNLCESACLSPTAHLCSEHEIVASLQQGIAVDDGRIASPTHSTCINWSNPNGSGAEWNENNGQTFTGLCSDSVPFVCCDD